MSFRCNAAEVKSILSAGGDYDTEVNPSLTQYIQAANLITTRLNSKAVEEGEALTSEELAVIEAWLAAHSYCCSDQQKKEEKIMVSTDKYWGDSDKGLDGSKYGQQAMVLDHTGILKRLNSSNKIRVLWGGLAPSEQTDYLDRD